MPCHDPLPIAAVSRLFGDSGSVRLALSPSPGLNGPAAPSLRGRGKGAPPYPSPASLPTPLTLLFPALPALNPLTDASSRHAPFIRCTHPPALFPTSSQTPAPPSSPPLDPPNSKSIHLITLTHCMQYAEPRLAQPLHPQTLNPLNLLRAGCKPPTRPAPKPQNPNPPQTLTCRMQAPNPPSPDPYLQLDWFEAAQVSRGKGR